MSLEVSQDILEKNVRYNMRRPALLEQARTTICELIGPCEFLHV